MSRFINAELKSDSDLDSEVQSKSDAKLMAKLEKSDFDSDSDSEKKLNKMLYYNFTSNINRAIRPVLNLFFLCDKISQVQKSIKMQV